ncbi:MAG: hypothetical protein IIC56_07150, partial [Proteobacteria bacterium]|nr:hypothetical protein [Pseudomonadota bacterium]
MAMGMATVRTATTMATTATAGLWVGMAMAIPRTATGTADHMAIRTATIRMT